MTVQQQYADILRQSQEAWTGAVENVTENVRATFTPTPAWGTPNPTAAVDQVFDFWKKTLEIQHGIARQLVSASLATGESVRDQAAAVGEAVKDQAESVGALAREQVESILDAARKQAEDLQQEASRKYDPLTKEQLQEELAKRNLPKSGTVEELRDRLLADDQK